MMSCIDINPNNLAVWSSVELSTNRTERFRENDIRATMQ
jgi:hypothetical protein